MNINWDPYPGIRFIWIHPGLKIYFDPDQDPWVKIYSDPDPGVKIYADPYPEDKYLFGSASRGKDLF